LTGEWRLDAFEFEQRIDEFDGGKGIREDELDEHLERLKAQPEMNRHFRLAPEADRDPHQVR
jgi:hypothetical protein